MRRNPHVELKLLYEDGALRAMKVRAPIKGEGLRITEIGREQEPEVFGALLVSRIRPDWPGAGNDLASATRARLAEIGFLVSEDQVSHPVAFACDIDDLPMDLVPRRAPRSPVETCPADVRVNPTLRYFGPAGPPPEMRGRWRLANPFRTDRSWIWFQDPSLSVASIYSARLATAETLAQLVPGQPPPASLPPNDRQRFIDVGILESAAAKEQQQAVRSQQVASAQQQLRQARYTVLRHVIRPFQLAAVRRYYRELIAEGFLRFGDKEWRDCHFAAEEPMAHFFHQQFAGLVSEIAGERVRPTFLFFRCYYPGAELPRHRDRPQCEYSMSVLVDHAPEPDDVSPWPIYLEPPGGGTGIPIRQGLGDALLYRGCELPHFRYPLREADSSSVWLFFYVGESFTGPLE